MDEVKKNPFEGLSKKTKTLIINGEKIQIKPKVKDAEIFISMKKEMTLEEAAKMTGIMKNMIKRANPNLNEEDVEAHVAMNYGEWIKQITIAYGFTTKEKFEAMEKKLTSQ